MGLTGVIYAAIVVAWAIFLVPLALRRHDQTARSRSIERFSSTMRVLSVGGRGASSRVVVTPRRDTDRVLAPAGSTAAVHAPQEASLARPVDRPALRAAAARRRRVLRVLVALTLLTAAVSLTGLIPVWSFVLPLLLIAAFLVLARRQVRLADEAYWARAATSRPTATNVVRRSAARVDASHGAARAPARDGGDGPADDRSPAERTADEADDEPTVTLTAQQMAAAADVAQEHAVAVSLQTTNGASLWDPLPVTLPTYVSKPVAKRTVRNIAVGQPGTWSSGHAPANGSSAGGAASEQMRETVDRHETAGDEAPPDTRRAANG